MQGVMEQSWNRDFFDDRAGSPSADPERLRMSMVSQAVPIVRIHRSPPRFNNKGKTRVEVTKIDLGVSGIKSGEPLQEWTERPPRLLFGHKLVDEENVITDKVRNIFFEPGITQQ
jgi:hypothetical protein